jgi:hypothetical protein
MMHMSHEHKEVLTDRRDYLVNSISLHAMWSHLRECRIVTQVDEELIKVGVPYVHVKFIAHAIEDNMHQCTSAQSCHKLRVAIGTPYFRVSVSLGFLDQSGSL